MDWTQIIIAVISGLFVGGGLMLIFTRKEVKDGKAAENMQKVVDSMQKSLDAKDRIIEEQEQRRKELKDDVDKKDAKIDELQREKSAMRDKYEQEKSEMRDQIDDLKTKNAVSSMMRCIKIKCDERDPPFGSIVDLAGLKDADLVSLSKTA